MTSPTTQQAHHSRRWLVLAVIGTAQLMIVLDATIVNVALPAAQHALGFANSDRQWIVTAYALAFGSLLLLGGKVGDIFGRKWTFIGGLIGFALASAAGGAAPDFAVLATARALQGVFGALLAPSALTLLATTFTDPKERAKAFAVFGAIAGGGGAVGLFLGGVLTSYLSWRWCLYVNLIFAVIAVVGGLLLIVNPPRGERPRIDLPGTVLASGGLFGIVFGFAEAQTDGWGSAETIIALIVGLVLLVGFVQVQRTSANPLLPLRIVLNRNRAGAYLAVGLTFLAAFSLFLFLTYFLQDVRGWSPVRTGASFVPVPLDLIGMSFLANVVLLPRFGSRRLVIAGLLLGAAGMALLIRIHPGSSYVADILPSLVLEGLAFGCIVPPAFNSATHGVAFKDAGVASAMVNTMQQVGGSVGTALLSTLSAEGASHYRSHHHSGLGATSLANAAATHGYAVAFATSTGIYIVAAIVCGLLIRRHTPEPTTTETIGGAAETPSPSLTKKA